MRVVVASCWNYRDAWKPCFELLEKFWPDCPHPRILLTDKDYDGNDEGEYPLWVDTVAFGENWGGNLDAFACTFKDAPVLVLQEDFFLNAPVNEDMVEHALNLMERQNLGAVRLYPCPGGAETNDDPYFGRVERHTQYRTSCQATIWRPEYLHAIASRFNTPSEFELQGSPWASSHLPAEVWAFKREVEPWPISYYCSAISRGEWEPAALEFCKQQGIDVDLSLRPIRAA